MVGSEALIRVSSSTLPSLTGTLKSTRMNARWPRRTKSLIDSLDTKAQKESQTLGRDVLNEIANTAGITPFVVVPRKHLKHPPTDHFRVLSVDDRRVRIAFEVD